MSEYPVHECEEMPAGMNIYLDTDSQPESWLFVGYHKHPVSYCPYCGLKLGEPESLSRKNERNIEYLQGDVGNLEEVVCKLKERVRKLEGEDNNV